MSTKIAYLEKSGNIEVAVILWYLKKERVFFDVILKMALITMDITIR